MRHSWQSTTLLSMTLFVATCLVMWPTAVSAATRCAGVGPASGFIPGYDVSGDNDIALGEETTVIPYFGRVGTGNLAVCWREGDGTEHLIIVEDCDTGSTQSEFVTIYPSAGDDRVGLAWDEFLCDGEVVFQFNDYFYFGLQAIMWTGADEAYGTPNHDYLYSYETQVTSDPDYAVDILCGFDGNDYLTGDGDDSSSVYEYMDGGDDSDQCHGGPDGWTYDLAHACTTVINAATTAAACTEPDASSWMSDDD